MKKVPKKTQLSLINGTWFVFEDEGHLIALSLSTFTGKEKIYFDGEIVTEGRNYSMRSVHQFRKNGIDYRLSFLIPKLFRGTIECTLEKDGNILKKIVTKPREKVKPTKLKIVLFLGLGILLGVVLAYFSHYLKIQLWVMFVFMFVIVYFVSAIRAWRNTKVEEIEC